MVPWAGPLGNQLDVHPTGAMGYQQTALFRMTAAASPVVPIVSSEDVHGSVVFDTRMTWVVFDWATGFTKNSRGSHAVFSGLRSKHLCQGFFPSRGLTFNYTYIYIYTLYVR